MKIKHGFSHASMAVMNPKRPGKFLRIELVHSATYYVKFEGEIPEKWDGSLVKIKATVIACVRGSDGGPWGRKLMVMIPDAEQREREAGMVAPKSDGPVSGLDGDFNPTFHFLF